MVLDQKLSKNAGKLEVALPPGSFSGFCKSIGVAEGENWPDRFGMGLRQWAKQAITTPIRTLSLFSGVGGRDIAFHDPGFAISHAVEIDERFAATLTVNAGKGGYLEGTEVVCRDVREFHPPQGYGNRLHHLRATVPVLFRCRQAGGRRGRDAR